MTKRRRRGERARGRNRIVLTDRDYDGHRFIGEVGYASVPQVARDRFPTLDVARRRVRAWFDAGLVRLALTASNAPALVALTRAGLAAVAARYPEDAAAIRLPGPVALAGVAHRLAVVDARIWVARLCADRGTPLLTWSSGAGSVARAAGLPAYRIAPDALFAVAHDGSSFRVAVEVDCRATEAERVIASKFERGARAVDDGVVDEIWVIVVGGAGRRGHVAACAAAAGVADHVRVVAHDATVARPAVGPPPTVAAGAATRDRASSPNTSNAVSTDRTARRDVQVSSLAADGTPDGWADGRGGS